MQGMERVTPYRVGQAGFRERLAVIKFFTDTLAPIVLIRMHSDSSDLPGGVARPAPRSAAGAVEDQDLTIAPGTPGRAVAADSSWIDVEVNPGVRLRYSVGEGAKAYQSYVLERVNGVPYRAGAEVVIGGDRYHVHFIGESRLFYRHKLKFCCD